MNDDLREKEDEYECFVFCLKHQEIGKRELKNGGKARILHGSIETGKMLQKFVGDKMPKQGTKSRQRQRKVVEEDDEEMNERDLEEEEDIDEDDEEIDVKDDGGILEEKGGKRRKKK